MSMLAEPRRKQKWSLNPRGKQWSEDSSKFGQRMLEKMGWSSGKGLGANEQGVTEHVRVSLKNNMGGIGYNNDNIDKAWTEHQDSFNEFLQKLQQGDSHNIVQTEKKKSELSGKSLELKSKQSRARVHYQKFTRGKDINKYSSKDLANIFGQKELNVNKSDTDKQEDNKDSFDAIGTQDNRGGVITINGGNMNEYFKKKGQTFPLTSVSEKQQENDSESEPEYAGFGFASTFGRVKSCDTKENKDTQNICSYAFENPCVQLDSPENISNSNDKGKPSRKRKSSDDSELSLSNKVKKMKENGIVNDALNVESQADDICNGKEFEVSRVQFGVTNSALDLSDEMDDKKRVTFNDHVEYSTDPIKKKKGRTTLDKFEVENKKSKKKKKHDSTVSNSISSGFVNEALDVETPDEVNDNEINERKSKKSKKRKGSRRSNLETIVEIPEEDKVCENGTQTKGDKVECNTSSNCMSQDTVSKKIKKKKHKEKTEVVAKIEENVEEIVKEEKISPIHENGDCEIHEDQEGICRKKKKKKNKDKDIESNLEKNKNVISEIQIKDDDTESIEKERAEVETVKVKKKKKSKKDDVNDVNTKTEIMDEKEISDKENTKNANETKVEKSKQKEHKQLESEPTINNTHNKGFTQKSTTETNRVRNRNTSNRFNRRPHISSPWNNRARMSKRLLMSLFHRNSVINFPGSNIDEIKGYGADVQ